MSSKSREGLSAIRYLEYEEFEDPTLGRSRVPDRPILQAATFHLIFIYLIISMEISNFKNVIFSFVGRILFLKIFLATQTPPLPTRERVYQQGWRRVGH